MSGSQEVQVQDRQVAVSDDDLIIMDCTDIEKEPESGADRAGAQTDKCERRWGRCRGRKFMRKQMEMEDGGCYYSSHHEKKMMKKQAKKWMKKMMWRRMMFRMCYGGPFGMGFGLGGRRRRMMPAMMDSTDTSGDSDQQYGGGWRHRRCRRRFGRHFGDEKRQGQTPENHKERENVPEVSNATEDNVQNTVVECGSNVEVPPQKSAAEDQTRKESAEGGKLREKKCRRKEHKKWKNMRRVHYCDTSSDSSSDSSSSSSESSANDDAETQGKKSKEGFRRCRRGWRHHQHHQGNVEGKDNAPDDLGPRGKGAWKGRKFHKKMMKRMGRKGHFKRF